MKSRIREVAPIRSNLPEQIKAMLVILRFQEIRNCPSLSVSCIKVIYIGSISATN